MTAHDLIGSIFARVQAGAAGNVRMITRPQLDYLRALIGQDPEGGALRKDGPYIELWAPMGRWKYVIEENPQGRMHKLTRLGSLAPTGTGRLF